MPKIKSSAFSAFIFNHFWVTSVLGAIIITALFAFFSHVPQLQRMGRSGDLSVSAKEEELASVENLLDQYDRRSSNLAKIQGSDMEKLGGYLPDSPLLPSLMVEIDALASRNGLVLEAFQSQERQKGDVQPRQDGATVMSPFEIPKIGVMDMQLTFRGVNYSSLKSFLKEVELSLRLIDFVSMNMSAGGEKVELILRTYYLKR